MDAGVHLVGGFSISKFLDQLFVLYTYMGVYTWLTSIVNAEYLTLGGGGFSYPLFSLPCGSHFKVLTLKKRI